ncbi:MAG: hypothetical protein AUG91_07480 [Actinobacteria bacterium 13_1_20CM_4_69_9]|nr:MAG: hypothetical protein AUG91_07480 [Actinobacteria bacterium 13_1_20CM_4_69_9]
MIWAWNAVLPPLWAGQATGVAPGDGLGPGVAAGLGEGVAGGVLDGRAMVGEAVGVGAAVVRAAEVAGGVTKTGAQATLASSATAHNRTERASTAGPV